MKAKAPILAASLLVAATSTSTAQVYSVNAVGYVSISVPAHGWAALGVPLNGPTNNSLNAILPLPSGSGGCTVYRWDAGIQAYLDSIAWVDDYGWFSPSDPNPTINPGEGFFLQNTSPDSLNIRWTGEVPAGTLHNPVLGGNRWNLKSSIVPKEGRLEEIGFPPCDGDTVYVFDSICQCYLDTYAYVADYGGWFSPSDPDPRGPVIKVGSGFFIQRGACPAADWVQTFSVN